MAKKGKYTYEWPRPMVTADVVVLRILDKNTEILLIQRGIEPFRGYWALPGGFVEMEEELEDAAARELFEETGLFDVQLEQIGTFGRLGRDPRGRVISVVYMGILDNEQKQIEGRDDAEKVEWFDIDKLPEKIAFDHREIMDFAINKMREQKFG